MHSMPPTYAVLLKTVSKIWDKASNTAATQANEAILQARWEIGRRILETEHTQAGRGDYGKRIIIKLAQDLRKRYGPQGNFSFITLITHNTARGNRTGP
jgi:DUF1016 N-terminal domain